MASEVFYMLAVVAAGFAVNLLLRALPFILFAGRGRKLPPWVAKTSGYVSPVIIACLVVYSYCSLEWRTLSPYLAGLATVALQLWKKNPLLGILAGTIVYMALV